MAELLGFLCECEWYWNIVVDVGMEIDG